MAIVARVLSQQEFYMPIEGYAEAQRIWKLMKYLP
jgi:hypothetical protein